MTEKEQKYFEILLERIEHKVDIIAEGHCTLDEKMERFHKESKADHQLSMDLIKHSYDVLKEEIQGVRIELKEYIQAVDKKLTTEIRVVGDKVNRASRESPGA